MGGANRGVRSVSFAHNAAARPLSLEGVVSKAEDLGTPSTVAKLEAEALAHRARRFDDANVVTAGLSEALAHRSTPTIPQSSFIDVGISPEVLIEAGWLPPQTIDRVLPESLRAEFEAWILAKESGLPPNDSPSLTTRHPWLQALITIDRETGQTNEMLVGLTSPETDVIERALRLLARDFLFRVASNLTASGYPNREVKIQITIYRYLVGSEGHRLSLHTDNGFFQYIYTLEASPNLGVHQLLAFRRGAPVGVENTTIVPLRSGRGVLFQESKSIGRSGGEWLHGVSMKPFDGHLGYRTAVIMIMNHP